MLWLNHSARLKECGKQRHRYLVFSTVAEKLQLLSVQLESWGFSTIRLWTTKVYCRELQPPENHQEVATRSDDGSQLNDDDVLMMSYVRDLARYHGFQSTDKSCHITVTILFLSWEKHASFADAMLK